MKNTQNFTTRHKGRANRLVNEVAIARPFQNDDERPQDRRSYLALWDTGATNTVITEKVANECSLIPSGMVKIATASGECESPTYFVSVWLPNKVVVPYVKASQGILSGDIEILIGMDIIGLGDFAVTNKDGITVFSFRHPSCMEIDFVKEFHREKALSRKNRPKKTQKRR